MLLAGQRRKVLVDVLEVSLLDFDRISGVDEVAQLDDMIRLIPLKLPSSFVQLGKRLPIMP